MNNHITLALLAQQNAKPCRQLHVTPFCFRSVRACCHALRNRWLPWPSAGPDQLWRLWKLWLWASKREGGALLVGLRPQTQHKRAQAFVQC